MNIMKKRFGQNFLRSPFHIQKIVAVINEHFKDDRLVEIGPGDGSITKKIVNYKLTVIEIDQERIIDLEKINGIDIIINADFLKVEDHLINNTQFFSNLPYHLALSIILRCRMLSNFKKGIFIFQKEVVDKIFSTKNNRVKFIFNNFFVVKRGLEIPGNCFFPKVKVHGKLIYVEKKESTISLEAINKSKIFSKVRKKLKNTINIPYFDENISNLLLKRVEELSFEETLSLIILETNCI